MSVRIRDKNIINARQMYFVDHRADKVQIIIIWHVLIVTFRTDFLHKLVGCHVSAFLGVRTVKPADKVTEACVITRIHQPGPATIQWYFGVPRAYIIQCLRISKALPAGFSSGKSTEMPGDPSETIVVHLPYRSAIVVRFFLGGGRGAKTVIMYTLL